MPQGLQVYDSSGNLVVDISDKLTRVLGITTTGTSDGSVTDANFALGTPWWAAGPINGGIQDGPQFSIAGTTLSWTFVSSGAAQNTSAQLIYGIY